MPFLDGTDARRILAWVDAYQGNAPMHRLGNDDLHHDRNSIHETSPQILLQREINHSFQHQNKMMQLCN